MSSCVSLDSINLSDTHSISEGISKESFNENEYYDFSYKEAIKVLNELQKINAQCKSNAVWTERCSNSFKSLEKTYKFLSLIDIKPSDLNKLNVIHVSGTKGKGSTCAFTESILRHSGYKTGFYSSPHLVAVRERIRLNGEPLTKKQFCKYFWFVYKTIEKRKDETIGMPPFFMFLTLMSYKVFLEEKVDVTVLEVGIGGQYDGTNVVPKPIVTGVTSLGLDHCNILGDTIEQIAWHKAGIFKTSVPAFTVEQPEEAMKVLRNRAEELSCSLQVSPSSLSQYPQSVPIELGIKGDVQTINASLAIQLTYYWINKMVNKEYQTSTLITKDGKDFADVFPLSKNFMTRLSKCLWLGRCQILNQNNIIYFLDGAHTYESLANCSKWFEEESKKLLTSNRLVRVLIFNCTGDRPADRLIKALKLEFNYSIFCPNKVSNKVDMSSDNFTVSSQNEMDTCAKNAQIWAKNDDKSVIAKLSNISEGIDFIKDLTQKERALPVHVLVTGSVYLVGGVLSLIDPELNSH